MKFIVYCTTNIVNKKMDVSTQVTGIITCSTMLISSLLIPILTKRWQKKSLKRKEAKYHS